MYKSLMEVTSTGVKTTIPEHYLNQMRQKGNSQEQNHLCRGDKDHPNRL
jgi:hypothetical protein